MNFCKTRNLFLFLLLSLSFDSHVIAMSYKEENIYWYGYTWGGIFTTCASYKANLMATNDAKYMIESMVEVAKEKIKDVTTYESLMDMKYSDVFQECRHLMPN